MKKCLVSLSLIVATMNTAFAQSPPQASPGQLMRWDAENKAFDILARLHFKLIENRLDGRVANLTFESADEICVVKLGYVGALPGKGDVRPQIELPKGWMVSDY